MDADYSITLEAVKAFVAVRVGIPVQELREDTRIEEDVAIAGLDTLTLYTDFFEAFQVENPEAFNPEVYTTPEVLPLRRLVKAVFSKTAREKLNTKTVTIHHLVLVVMRREWFEPE